LLGKLASGKNRHRPDEATASSMVTKDAEGTESSGEQRTEVLRALRPQAKIDLILTLDPLLDLIDVRSTIVYAVEEARVILAQPEPPIVPSRVGNEVEATLLIRERRTGELRRWGYLTTIREIIRAYRLYKDDPITQQAVVIGAPVGELVESNLRLHYRIRVAPRYGIAMTVEAFPGPVTIHDISGGGALISAPALEGVSKGGRFTFTLSFPDHPPITGEAEVRRLVFRGKGTQPVAVGVKFVSLDVASARVLQRAISSLMLEEVRDRPM
jgi:PilZ domain